MKAPVTLCKKKKGGEGSPINEVMICKNYYEMHLHRGKTDPTAGGEPNKIEQFREELL